MDSCTVITYLQALCIFLRKIGSVECKNCSEMNSTDRREMLVLRYKCPPLIGRVRSTAICTFFIQIKTSKIHLKEVKFNLKQVKLNFKICQVRFETCGVQFKTSKHQY